MAGATHVCGLAITASRQIYCWGRNNAGQIGDGTTGARLVPTGLTGIPALSTLAAGSDHTCGIARETGFAYCWGNNADGQLGDGHPAQPWERRPDPVVVPITDVVQIAGGGIHTVALKRDGTLWAWGNNQYGQLGNMTNTATTKANPTPAQVTGLSGVTAIAAGWYHSLALKSLSVTQQVAQVITQIQNLVTAGTLSTSQGAGLITKLNAVIAKLSAGQTLAACNQLNAFINQVNGFINSGALSQGQGQALITVVNNIKANIGC